MSRIDYVIRLLQDAPYTIEQLTHYYQVDRRTVRRWLEGIETRGYYLVREGAKPTSPYRILKKLRKGP